jgi:hypothetical protein
VITLPSSVVKTGYTLKCVLKEGHECMNVVEWVPILT